MKADTLLAFVGYHAWANDRILTTAAGLSDEEFLATGKLDHDSVFQTLRHLMDVDWSWREFCIGHNVGDTCLWDHGFVLDDLPSLPEQPAVVVEGPQILPDLLPQTANAIFLNATPDFQRAVLSPRPMPSSDPARALAARLVKDRLYADRVAALAREHAFPVLAIDGTPTS